MYQAPNSEKNPLRELNGELRGLIVKKFVKELVEEISSQQQSINKASKKFFTKLQKGFGWSLIAIPLIAYLLFSGSRNEELNIATTDSLEETLSIEEPAAPKNTIANEYIDVTTCINNAKELYSNQWLMPFVYYEYNDQLCKL